MLYLFVAGAAAVLLGGGIWLWLIEPHGKRSIAPFNRFHYAHRGLHTNDSRVPENSLAAFRAAAKLGVAVELDVQFSADGQVVVFHDNTLLRMCGIDKRVDALPYDELKTLSLSGSEQRIPLLSEVLEVLDGAPVLCEFKSRPSFTDTTLCAAAWELLKDYKGPVCIESFNPMMVRWFKKHQPQVIRGVLSCEFEKDSKEVSPAVGWLLKNLLLNFLARPDFVAYRHTDVHTVAFRLCRRLFRCPTIAWTIHSQQEETTALTASFDTVIFEDYLPEKSR